MENYELKTSSIYGSDFLTLNTNSTTLFTDDIVTLEGNRLSEKVESGVAKFKHSLDKMIKVNDCSTALNYVQTTYELSARKSADQTLSPGKRYYHKRIKEVTEAALKNLKDCK